MLHKDDGVVVDINSDADAVIGVVNIRVHLPDLVARGGEFDEPNGLGSANLCTDKEDVAVAVNCRAPRTRCPKCLGPLKSASAAVLCQDGRGNEGLPADNRIPEMIQRHVEWGVCIPGAKLAPPNAGM